TSKKPQAARCIQSQTHRRLGHQIAPVSFASITTAPRCLCLSLAHTHTGPGPHFQPLLHQTAHARPRTSPPTTARAAIHPSMAQPHRRVLRVAPPGSAGGSGDGEAFPTVQAAVDAVPLGNRERTVIRLAPGVYREPVYVPKTKNFITLAGASAEATVISWDNTATRIKHAQTSRVIGTGTFGCGTVIVEGEDFIAENITFQNSAPQVTGCSPILLA
uniref:pectinesterase n=1 Tax=Aegilops tauschii subsp. strangulata TaxID=200361 RepID=A0A452YMV7_AEGTS